MFIGNSSSGIYEMPILQVPVINLGDRQKGRLLSNGILSTNINFNDIIFNINNALNMDKNEIKSVYESYNSSNLIIESIRKYLDNPSIIKKFNNIYE